MTEQRPGPSAEDVATAVRQLQAELERSGPAIIRALEATPPDITAEAVPPSPGPEYGYSSEGMLEGRFCRAHKNSNGQWELRSYSGLWQGITRRDESEMRLEMRAYDDRALGRVVAEAARLGHMPPPHHIW